MNQKYIEGLLKQDIDDATRGVLLTFVEEPFFRCDITQVPGDLSHDWPKDLGLSHPLMVFHSADKILTLCTIEEDDVHLVLTEMQQRLGPLIVLKRGRWYPRPGHKRSMSQLPHAMLAAALTLRDQWEKINFGASIH